MKPRDNGKDRAEAAGRAPLGRRPASGLDQTLPLGTPQPAPVQPSRLAFDRGPDGARGAYKQTILLGTREPRSSEAPAPSEPSAPVTTAVPPASSRSHSEGTAGALTLRGSFVRVVGPPTAPPPRRSRRSGVAWEPDATAPVSEPRAFDPSTAVEGDQHEAFALHRPLASTGEASTDTSTPESVVVSRGSWHEVAPAFRTGGVMLPPPPGVSDFEPASGPDSAPPPPLAAAVPIVAPAGAESASAVASRAASARAVSAPQPSLDELPSVNPFAGFEAPRESWGRRSAFVFTLALALVGLCGLVAIALGLLGKRGW